MIHIWVRETVDWEDEAAFRAQMPADLPAKVDLWNATLTIPFHLFRARVRRIAELNHSRVEGAARSDWDEIPDGALVLPVDDDDWFAPDAATVLAARLDPDAAGYHWPASWVEVPTYLGHRVHLIRRRLLPRTRPKWICSTNNYAIVKGPDTKPLLESHVRASLWFDGPGAERVRRCDNRLSLTNRTLASRTTLRVPRTSISKGELLRKFRSYKTLYERPLPPDLAWGRPYVALMSELMAELELR